MTNKLSVRINSRYVKDVSAIEGHLKYVGFRSQEIDKNHEGLFSKNSSYVNWKEYIHSIKNHAALQHSQTVKVHQLLISMREADYHKYKNLSGNDFYALTRKIMKELELKKGVPLDWAAAFHAAEGHPHVHIVLKAVSDPQPNSNARSVRIRIDKDDIEFIRQRLKNEVELYLTQQKSQEEQHTYSRNDFKLLEQFTNSIMFEVDKMKRQQEKEHDKLLKKQQRKAQQRNHDNDRS